MEELNKEDLCLIQQLIHDEIKNCKWRLSRNGGALKVSNSVYNDKIKKLRLLNLKIEFKIINME